MFDLSQLNKKELYRLIVDGDLHQSEQGFFDYMKREPGCLPAAFNALQHALTNLEEYRISPQLIIELHHRILMNVKNINAGSISSFRETHTGYNFKLGVYADEHGVNVLSMRYAAFGTVITDYKLPSSYKSPEHYNEVMNALEPIEHPSEVAKQQRILLYRAPDAETIESLIFFICESYNHAILLANSDEKKLSVIASHLQYIDQLHPFSDGNIRTCYILLQRMLIQQGFPPCMMNQPNCFDVCSTEGIVSEIKEGMHNTQYLIDNPGEGIFGYITKKINETTIDNAHLAPEIKTSIKSNNDELRHYYDSQDKLHEFLSQLPQSSHEDNPVIEQKNNALSIAILSWVRATIFEQDPLQSIPPDLKPNPQKIAIVHRLLVVQHFFNEDPIEQGIELDYLLSKDGLEILTKYLDDIEQQIEDKKQPLVDSSQLIKTLKFKQNQQKIEQIIQIEMDTLTQYNDTFTHYQGARYIKNPIKKLSFLEQFQQLIPDNTVDDSKEKLNEWLDCYKLIKQEKNDALAELEASFLKDFLLDLEPTLCDEIEEWVLQYQQFDNYKLEIAEKHAPDFPEKLNNQQFEIMTQWKERYTQINHTYLNAMIELDGSREIAKSNAMAVRVKTTNDRVKQAVMINANKSMALNDLQGMIRQQSDLAGVCHAIDEWLESKSHIMASTVSAATFFNPQSSGFLQELKDIRANILERDDINIDLSLRCS